MTGGAGLASIFCQDAGEDVEVVRRPTVESGGRVAAIAFLVTRQARGYVLRLSDVYEAGDGGISLCPPAHVD